MAEPAAGLAPVFVELGAAILGLAVLSRAASRWGFSAIPLYLIAGLAFGNGGFLPLGLSEGFIHIGAEIGVLLLLFMLGLEYTPKELSDNLRVGVPAGAADLLLNFLPGLATGVLLGWPVLPAALLGGVTWISSSGIIARVLADQKRTDPKRASDAATKTVLTILVLEDLAMAVYLPLMAVLIRGGSTSSVILSMSVALGAVSLILFAALRYGGTISGWVAHESDEVVLLTTFGAVLLIAGLAENLQVSSAVGAFLVGVALSGPIAHQSQRVLTPLRDLFAATFFFFFGLDVAPASLLPVAWVAILMGVITGGTKVLTGYWSASRLGIDRQGSLRAGLTLVARGEFSIVIAELGAGMEPQLGPLAAAYVLFLAVLGPLVVKFAPSGPNSAA